MENQNTQSQSANTQPRIYSFEKDEKIIEDYFNSIPNYRIIKYCGKYWLQGKKGNPKETYKELSECYQYDTLNSIYLKNGYWFLWQAKRAKRLYITQPVITVLPN